jgi:hypothetical protein
MKVIHMAKRDRGLDDEAYRALLLGAAGVASASLRARRGRMALATVKEAAARLGLAYQVQYLRL